MNVLEKILEEKEIVAIKELIEENEKCFNQCEGACFDVEDGICNCDDGVIVQAIRKMKKYLELAKDTNVPSKNGWIPVSEKLPEDGVKHFSTENIQSQMRAAKLSNRMLTTGKSILRAIRDETTGEYAWFDNKYLKMFDGCTPNLIKYQGNPEHYDAVFTRYGEIIGIILPVRVSEW